MYITFSRVPLAFVMAVAAAAEWPSAGGPAPGVGSESQAPSPPVPPGGWRPSDPLRISGGSAYLDLGLVGTFSAGGSSVDEVGELQSGGHDPAQRGFNVQGVELNLSGAVDPYFRANVNVVYSMDAGGESFLELEEAWVESMALPWNLQLRLGQLYTDFGRHNPTHLHSWAFVDEPLVNGRFLGGDGLRNPGARLAWLLPLPFYAEWSMGVQNSHGETASSFRSAEEGASSMSPGFRFAENDRGLVRLTDLLWSTRAAASWDLSDVQTLLVGASAALGPNASGAARAGETTTQILGIDATWKWKSSRHHGGFPFVTWQTEAMLRCYELGAFDWDLDVNGAVDSGEVEDRQTGLPAVLPGEVLTDYGFYSQVLYGFRKGWVAGVRVDYVAGRTAEYERRLLALDGVVLGRDASRLERCRVSPDLTWYPSEFSKFRIQYSLDQREDLGPEHSVWLQFEFLLGAHAAHRF